MLCERKWLSLAAVVLFLSLAVTDKATASEPTIRPLFHSSMTAFDFGSKIGAAILKEKLLMVWDEDSSDVQPISELLPPEFQDSQLFDVAVYKDWIFLATGANLLHVLRYRQTPDWYVRNVVQNSIGLQTKDGLIVFDQGTHSQLISSLQTRTKRLEWQSVFVTPDHVIAGEETNVTHWPVFGVDISEDGRDMYLAHPHFVSHIHLNEFLQDRFQPISLEDVDDEDLPAFGEGIIVPHAQGVSVDDDSGRLYVMVRDKTVQGKDLLSLRIIDQQILENKNVLVSQGRFMPEHHHEGEFWIGGKFIKDLGRFFFIRKDGEFAALSSEDINQGAEALSRNVAYNLLDRAKVESLIRGALGGVGYPTSYRRIDEAYLLGSLTQSHFEEIGTGLQWAEAGGSIIAWLSVAKFFGLLRLPGWVGNQPFRVWAKQATLNFVRGRKWKEIFWFTKVGLIASSIAETIAAARKDERARATNQDGENFPMNINVTNVLVNGSTAFILGVIVTDPKVHWFKKTLLAAATLGATSHGSMILNDYLGKALNTEFTNPHQNHFERFGYATVGLTTPLFMRIQLALGKRFGDGVNLSKSAGVVYSFLMAYIMAEVFYPYIVKPVGRGVENLLKCPAETQKGNLDQKDVFRKRANWLMENLSDILKEIQATPETRNIRVFPKPKAITLSY